jgi:hypothetical protein
MPREPPSGKARHLFECARLFEQMRRARHDLELHFGRHPIHRLSIELNHGKVVCTDDQQCWRAHIDERISRQIGPAAARDHGAHLARTIGSRNERGTASGAGAKQADARGRVRLIAHPVNGRHEPLGQQPDVKAQMAATEIDLFFLGREEVHQQRREVLLVQGTRDESIAGAEPAAPTAVREQDDAGGAWRRIQVTREEDLAGGNSDLPAGNRSARRRSTGLVGRIILRQSSRHRPDG